MKRFIFFILLVLPISVNAATDIEFILDISGSMNKVDGGEKMIDSLRKALTTSIKDIPDDTYVAIRLYGHRVEQSKKDESCKDTEIAIPFGPVNREAIAQKINSVTPKGYTPIAYSLEQSRQDFDLKREATKTLILMTDGEETCGGDPIAVINKMKADGFDIKIHTVGFNVDANTKLQLTNIATAGGGQYFDASGSTGISTALTQATQAAVLLNKKTEITGTPIRGGDGFSTAVKLDTGIVYRLDHHQKVNDRDYFYIDVKAGQEITLGIATGEIGIDYDGLGGSKENRAPYGGIILVGPDQKEIKKEQIIGQQNGLRKIQYYAPQDGKYYVLLGTDYAMMHKDYVTFKVALTAKGDLDTESDAGSTMQTALKIEHKRYETNYLSKTDLVDIYSFAGKKGDKFKFGFIPYETDEPVVVFTVTDSYRQKIFTVTSQRGSGLKSDIIMLPEDDTYYLELEVKYSTPPLFKYMLELIKVEPQLVTEPH